MLNTLHKSERLDKKKVIDKMFSGGARSFSVFPLRVVYLPVEELEAPVSILVSVSKRRFKRAVKRNRVKRQIREAYRKNKHGLLQTLQDEGRQLAVAFIYLSDRLVDSLEIEERMKVALARITEKVLADVAVQKAKRGVFNITTARIGERETEPFRKPEKMLRLLRKPVVRGSHEKAVFILAVASHLFLSEVYFTPDFPFMSFHSYLFAICR